MSPMIVKSEIQDDREMNSKSKFNAQMKSEIMNRNNK